MARSPFLLFCAAAIQLDVRFGLAVIWPAQPAFPAALA
jgi:hypothetical protein